MSRILEIITPLGAGNAVLARLSGNEALGRLPEYQLTLVSRRGKVAPADLLGKNITVGLEMPGGREVRHFNGYVTQFADAGSSPAAWFGDGGGRAHQYQLTMHPWLWFLTRSANFRVFQSLTTPQVIQKVCDAYPFALLDASLLSASYPARECVCQYRETDYNFIARLMEQEGIYFSFAHQDGRHTMVLYDSHGAHAAREGYARIPYSDTGTDHPDAVEHITHWHASHEVQPGRFALSDFDFKKPRVSLLGTASNPLKHDLDGFEFFDFPGEYDTPAAGAAYAKIRLEELQARHHVISGAGAVRGIEPGRTFKLADHPHEELNAEYLVTGASYSIANNAPGSGGGGGADFHCSFQAIASRTQFRPQRATPKPVVQGPQTAIVVGPEGEEIHVDEHGRVKLQFQWDRYNKGDENSSCWVRVSQPWASKGWGALFLPRVGHEVIVEFLEGDPDRPIVTGRVNNGDAAPPWALPAQKTRSGFRTRSHKGGASNFNEFSFDDKQGAEEVFLQAERDHLVRVKGERVEEVGGQSHRTVGKDAFDEVKGDAHLKIGGDQNSEAGGSASLKVGQDWQAKAGMRVAVEAGNEIHLKAGMNVVIEAGVSLSLKVGGNFIMLNPGGVFVNGTMVMVNSGGAAGAGSGAAPIAPKPPKRPRASQGGSDMKPVRPKPPAAYSPQAQALKLAWQSGKPFCAKCEAAGSSIQSCQSIGKKSSDEKEDIDRIARKSANIYNSQIAAYNSGGDGVANAYDNQNGVMTHRNDRKNTPRRNFNDVAYQNNNEEDLVKWFAYGVLSTGVKITPTEVGLLNELGSWSPLNLNDFDNIKDKAQNGAIVAFPQPLNWTGNAEEWANFGHNDAYRHIYWNALLTQRFGLDWTTKFTTAHEGLRGNEKNREAQDLYNNEVGRRIGSENPDKTGAELMTLVFDAVKYGQAVVVDKNGNLKPSNTVPIGQHYIPLRR